MDALGGVSIVRPSLGQLSQPLAFRFAAETGSYKGDARAAVAGTGASAGYARSAGAQQRAATEGTRTGVAAERHLHGMQQLPRNGGSAGRVVHDGLAEQRGVLVHDGLAKPRAEGRFRRKCAVWGD